MHNQELKDAVVSRVLPNIRTPGQYVGGELNSVAKDHRDVRGTVCLAFPDTYALGMSHHGLQVLYSLMNTAGWACERAFTPLPDFEDASNSTVCRFTASRRSHRFASLMCWAFHSSTRSATRTFS